jgi:hypothetical protein
MKRKTIFLLIIWTLTLLLAYGIGCNTKEEVTTLTPALSPSCAFVLEAVERDTIMQLYIFDTAYRTKLKAAARRLK